MNSDIRKQKYEDFKPTMYINLKYLYIFIPGFTLETRDKLSEWQNTMRTIVLLYFAFTCT